MKFPKMCEMVPEGECGDAKIQHFSVSDEDAKFHNMRCSFSPGGGSQFIEPGQYCRLVTGGGVMMSDTPAELRSNFDVIWKAHGDVLIGGLGLGAIIQALCRKKEVSSVTIIEKSMDVITLVSPTLPEKATVIHGDVFTWKPEKGRKFDVVYFDIWRDICTDNLPEIAKLHQRGKYWLRRNGSHWMGSWQADVLKGIKRRENSSYW